MELSPNFLYQPTNPLVPTPITPPAPVPAPPSELGPLQGLVGRWQGTGFNTIWRPNHGAGGDHFLELNMTVEQLEFREIPGLIPNRGLLQGDLTMAGVHYLQQISDNLVPPNGLHIEPGVWLTVPATTDPLVPASIARLASIPHGTTVLAQGVVTETSGPPSIQVASIAPFSIGNRAAVQVFAEQQLGPNELPSRSSLSGLTQAMLDNPNSVLNHEPTTTTTTTATLTVSSDAGTPVIGGGTANTAFLQGGPDGPNAVAARVDATFWLQTRTGETEPGLLQYSQTVLLNFAGLSWPHVSVASLTRQPAAP